MLKGRYIKALRQLGNHQLKQKELAMHSFDHEETPAFKEPLAGGFSGAYLTSEPEITVVRLQPSDKWLVLGTDGLWDNLPIEQSVAVIQKLLFIGWFYMVTTLGIDSLILLIRNVVASKMASFETNH